MPTKITLSFIIICFFLVSCSDNQPEKKTPYNLCISTSANSCIMEDLTFNELKLQAEFSDEYGIDLVTPIQNEKKVEGISPTGLKRKKVHYSGSDFEVFYIEYVGSNYSLLADLNGELYSTLLIGAKNVNKTRGLEIDGTAEAVDLFTRIFPNRSSSSVDVFIENDFIAAKYENQSFVIVYKGVIKNSLVVGELKLKE